MAEFEEAYAFTRQHVGRKLELAVAVDGSRVGMKALELALSFMQAERNDTLDLIHVIDQEASILQAPEHIQKQCELIASKAGAKLKFHAQPKMEEGVIATIARTAERTRADLLLVGAYGLKIEAGAEPKDSFSVMGSVSDGAYPRHVRASMSHTWSMSGLPLAARAPPTRTYNRSVRVRRMTRGHAPCAGRTCPWPSSRARAMTWTKGGAVSSCCAPTTPPPQRWPSPF